MANSNDKSDSGLYYLLVCIPLIIISGFRGNFGKDASNYNYSYYLMQTEGFSRYLARGKELGYAIIQKIVGDLSGYSMPAFLLACYTLILFCYARFFHRYSKKVWLSFVLLIVIGGFYTSYNTFRQFLACSLYLISLHFLIEKELWPYIISVIAVSSVHTSALFMIPLYWALNYNSLSKRKRGYNLIVIATAALSILAVSWLYQIAGALVGRYANYEDLQFGLNLGTFVKPAFFWGIGLYNRRQLNGNDRMDKIYWNALFLYTYFLLAASRIHMIYRFTYYVLPIILIMIPDILSRSSGSKKTTNSIFLAVFLVVYFFAAQYGAEFYFVWEK